MVVYWLYTSVWVLPNILIVLFIIKVTHYGEPSRSFSFLREVKSVQGFRYVMADPILIISSGYTFSYK